MKKVYSVLALAIPLFFQACTSSPTATLGSTSESKDLENNRKVYKAIETGNLQPIDSLIANDAVDHQGPNGGEIRGGDSIKHMLADMHNHAKDLKFDII